MSSASNPAPGNGMAAFRGWNDQRQLLVSDVPSAVGADDGLRQRAWAMGRRPALIPVRYGAIGNATGATAREDM